MSALAIRHAVRKKKTKKEKNRKTERATLGCGFVISPWQDKFVFKTLLTGVDLEKKEATLSDGRVIKYNKMLSTMPLDLMLKMVGKDEWANDLFHSSSHIVGIGKSRCDCDSNNANTIPTYTP